MAPSLEFCFGSPFLWLWSLLSSALLIRFPSELLEETGTYDTFLQRLDDFCVASLNHKLSSLTTQSQGNLIQSPVVHHRLLTPTQICNYARHTKKPVLTRSRVPLHRRLDLGRQNEPISTPERYRIRRGNHVTRESKRFYQIYLCVNAPLLSKIVLTSLHQHHGLSKKLTPLIMLKVSSKTTSSSTSAVEIVEDISPSR